MDIRHLFFEKNLATIYSKEIVFFHLGKGGKGRGMILSGRKRQAQMVFEVC